MLVVVMMPGAIGAASFTASLDRDTITLGEQATLSLKFEGVQPQAAPDLPSIPGLQFQYVGPSTSFSYINGQTTSSVTYNYVVTPQHEGEFTIPGMRADVGNQQVSSAPLKLTVTKVNAPSAAAVNSGSEVAFMRLTFPKQKVYVGEAEVARLEIYVRDDVQNFVNFQMTGSPTDGFSAGNSDEEKNQRRRVQVGNRIYTVIPLAIPLTAVRTGELTLGPFTASAVVVLPSQNQNRGGDPFFRQFFNQSVQKQVTLASQSLTVESLPLPTQDQPTNFTGAVGDFTMSATAGPTTVTVGDPITVNVKISGHGDFSSLTLPPQSAWRDFKTYPPTAKLETTDQFGFQGTKTFEQIVSPENAEVKELPELSFSYFNPNDGKYHTLTEPSVPLTVHAAAATPMPTLAAAQKPTTENQSPQDILPIKDKLGTLATGGAPLIMKPAFIALQGVPVLAFIAAFIWRKRTDSLANNPRLRRQRAVAQLIRAGLNDLKQFAAENQPDEFFALLFRLLQEQLGERLDCPASAITENVIDEHAVLQTVPVGTLDSLRELFQLCNQARYAPVRGTSELNSVAARLEKTIGELQEVRV
ncbi:MAG TPA: BatD family protein [Candidatus Binatia bacterium]|nr:BatD family protein [Candidatus Binatia bacterium]